MTSNAPKRNALKRNTLKRNTLKRTLLSAVIVGAASLALAVTGAQAAAPPVKLISHGQFGREVNLTEVNAKGGPSLEDICTTESKDQCQPGQENEGPGGYKFPEGVAGTASGSFYVADIGNSRVQELESDGKFVLMFGKEVDATTKGDICTAASKDACKAGVTGASAGQFESPQSVAVDPVSGDIYVAEVVFGTGGAFGQRVQKFTAGGQFVLEIGKEVNKTTKGNLCTQEETEKGVECGGPTQTTPGSFEHGSFDFQGRGNVLADGGEHDLLYVGEEGRVQEFEANGRWKGEIPLTGTAEAIAVDAKADVYVVYKGQNILHEFDSAGSEVGSLEIPARVANAEVFVVAIAVDSAGHIAVVAREELGTEFGLLYEAATGLSAAFKLPGFTIPEGVSLTGIGFDGKGELYAAAENGQEVLSYTPKPVAEVRTVAATSGGCKEAGERETSVTFNCQLEGEVNPYNIAKTEVWFEWGRTCALGTVTPRKEVETVTALLPVGASIEGLRPNESFCYELAGGDQNVQPPEQLVGEPSASVSTPAVPAKIVGVPSASFVTSSSAVMHGELNPENSNTEYFFEYAPELQAGEKALASCPGIKAASCPGVASTSPVGESALYGRLGTTVEAGGLQPNTTYQYRLAASNAGGASHSSEGTLTTPSAPRVEAETGSFGEVTPTSALVSGTVNPDGQPARYMFELGVYQGAATHFGTVLSGPTGTTAEAKSLLLTGLQPGTTYAYRVAIASGYGTATGAPVTFTTAGLASVLALPPVLAQLPIPTIAFPAEAKPPPQRPKQCKLGHKRDRHHKCVKTRKKHPVHKTARTKRARHPKR